MAYQPGEMTSAGGVSGTAPASAASYPPGTSAEEIRRDIERTRAEMDRTVDTLQERLRPRHLLDDALDALRSWSAPDRSPGAATANNAVDVAGQLGQKLVENLRDNPMPAALIGAGVAWMMFGGGKPSWGRRGMTLQDYQPRKWDVPDYSGSYVDARTGQPYTAEYGDEAKPSLTAGGPGSFGAPGAFGATAGGYGQPVGMPGAGSQQSGDSGPGMLEKARGAVAGVAGSVKDAVTGAAGSTRDALSSAGDRASGWAGSARDSAGQAGGALHRYGDRAGEYAGYAADQARYGARATAHAVQHGIERYPVAMGAAAMALGVLSGLLLPATEAEDRLLGERADQLKDRVKETGEQVVEGGKQVVAAAAGAATDEASGQDVTPGSLAEKVRNVARDVKATAAESAEREGLDPDSLAQKAKQVATKAKDAAKDEAQRQKDQAM